MFSYTNEVSFHFNKETHLLTLQLVSYTLNSNTMTNYLTNFCLFFIAQCRWQFSVAEKDGCEEENDGKETDWWWLEETKQAGVSDELCALKGAIRNNANYEKEITRFILYFILSSGTMANRNMQRPLICCIVGPWHS